MATASQEGTQAKKAKRLARLAEAEARARIEAGLEADLKGAQRAQERADAEMAEAKEALERAEKEVLEAERAMCAAPSGLQPRASRSARCSCHRPTRCSHACVRACVCPTRLNGVQQAAQGDERGGAVGVQGGAAARTVGQGGQAAARQADGPRAAARGGGGGARREGGRGGGAGRGRRRRGDARGY